MGDTANELKTSGSTSDRIASYQQKLPKIAVHNISRTVSEVLETPSPNTYRRNVENQINDLVEVRNGTIQAVALQQPTTTSAAMGSVAAAVVNGQAEVFVNNNRMVTAAPVPSPSQNSSIKPPPKKQKIDMSTFDSMSSMAPKVERTISGTVLTKLEAPKLKMDPHQQHNLSMGMGAQTQMSDNDYQAETAEARNEQPRASNNPFDVAFKTANNSPMTEMNGGDQRQETEQPFSPLKTSDIPDIVQQLDVERLNQGGSRVTTMQAVGASATLGSAATALKQSSIATIGNSLFLVAPNTNGVPLLLSPKFQPLLAATPQPATILTNSTNQTSFVQPQHVITLAADATNSQPLILFPNPQQIVPAAAVTVASQHQQQQQHISHSGTVVVHDSTDLITMTSQPFQQMSSNKLVPTLSNSSSSSHLQQQQQQQMNGLSGGSSGLRPPPAVTSALVGGTQMQHSPLGGVKSNSGASAGVMLASNGDLGSVPSAKAIMREQLERKKNNSSIVATVSFPSSRGAENMMTPSNDSSLMARGASLGATNPSMNSVMTAVSGGGGGGNNMAPLQNGSNFLADSTTRLGEHDPRYSLTREKNREAAQRCREKRKKWIANLQEENTKLKTENVKLKEQVSTLQHELMDLKTRLLNEHSLTSHYINSSSSSSASTNAVASQNNRLQMMSSSTVGNGSGGGVGPRSFDQEMMISSFGAGGGTTSVPGTGTNSLHVMPLPPSKPKPHLPFSDHILNGSKSHLSVPQAECLGVMTQPQNNLTGDHHPNLSNPVTTVFNSGTSTNAPSTPPSSALEDISDHHQPQEQQPQSMFSQPPPQNSASNFSEQFYESSFNGMENDFDDTENENEASDQFMSSDDLKPSSSDLPVTQLETPQVTLQRVEEADDIFRSSSSLHGFPSDERRPETSVLVVEHQQRPSSTGNLPSIKNEAISLKSLGGTLLHNPSAGVVIHSGNVHLS